MDHAYRGEAERLRLEDKDLRADYDRIPTEVAAGALAVFGTIVAAPTANDIQTLTIAGTPPSGGGLTVFGRKPPRPYAAVRFDLDFDSSAAAAQTAAEGAFGAGKITVSGGPLPGHGLVFTFTGLLGDRPVPLMVADGSNLVGGDLTTIVGFSHTRIGEGPYPTTPQAYYVLNVLAVYGEQIQGGAAALTTVSRSIYVANLGNAIIPIGQQILATQCQNRWVTVYG